MDYDQVDRSAAQVGAVDDQPLVQRQTLPEAPQTASETPDTPPDDEPDLDRLARQIYPLVKRLLAVERERRGGRWS